MLVLKNVAHMWSTVLMMPDSWLGTAIFGELKQLNSQLKEKQVLQSPKTDKTKYSVLVPWILMYCFFGKHFFIFS